MRSTAAARSRTEFAPEGIRGELARLYYDTANATFAPAMAALMKLVPASQITFGTDYPYFPLDQHVDLGASRPVRRRPCGDRERQCDAAAAEIEGVRGGTGLPAAGAFAELHAAGCRYGGS